MADIEYTDNSATVKAALSSGVTAFLYEAGGELQGQAFRNSRVDNGHTRGSYQYKVQEGSGESTAHVGSNLQNAIWEEFGTGEYALHGDGRKGAWCVPADNYTGSKKPTYNGKVVIVYGKNGQKFYKTNGKKPNRPMYNAFNSLREKLKQRLEEILISRLG